MPIPLLSNGLLSRYVALALAVLLSAVMVLPVLAWALGADVPTHDPADDVSLAASAGPPHVAAAATIYRRTPRGYEVARAGTNSFACLVEQSHPDSVEPICYDREGATSHLPVTLARAAWRAQGVDDAEIARRVEDGYAQGTFRVPNRPGIAYMLSPATRFWNAATQVVEPGAPHLMFYAPNVTNADIGSRGEHHPAVGVPFVIDEGTPNAYIVVLVPAQAAASSR